MHLQSIEVENFKCFWKPQKALIGKGFNIFVGANNSGKTTMLEALDLNVGINVPHRSINNLLEYGARPEGSSKFTATLITDINELHQVFGDQFYIPVPTNYHENFINIPDPEKAAIQRLLFQPTLTLTITFSNGQEFFIFESCLGRSGSVDRNTPNQGVHSLSLTYKDWADSSPIGSIANFGGVGPQIGRIREHLQRYIYRFSAHRRPAGECGNTGDPKLDREALHLPYCINQLQSNDAHRHRLLCEWVNRIFPSVSWIQAPPVHGAGTFQLQCLPLPPEKQRGDLATPLTQMGTGIGNIIAMLYVVLTSRHPQVIAIDEPNSFLHPRALRELLQILSVEGKQHQFILTAHSADVLTAVDPSLITLFQFDGASTTLKQVTGKEVVSLRSGLAELGIRMTDLHGRDRVLWVEGQTEEIVMPELLRHFCPEIAAGIAVLRVEHTGTFEKKGVDPKEVAKIYERLTESSVFAPPMIAILLDSEMRKPEECSRLQTESNGVLRFLDRAMLENYFLNPQAITAVLNALGEDISIEKVNAALTKATQGFNTVEGDGAKILKQIFSELSETRHEFKKTRDVPQIVSWLLSNEPTVLDSLGHFLRDVVGLPKIPHL